MHINHAAYIIEKLFGQVVPTNRNKRKSIRRGDIVVLRVNYILNVTGD